MVKVAITGGSGGLGRVITEAIIATGKHEVFVISRIAKKSFGVDVNIRYLVVDYSSPVQIAEVLRANQVEVVISAIGIVFEDTHLAQMNLIDGASQSGTVVRFAPSEYAIDYAEAKKSGFPFPVPGLAAYKSSQYKVEAFEKLKATKMEHTRFIIGFLMDYYGFPAEPVTVLPLAVVLDVENCKAGIPTDGESRITLTHSETIGKFVAASLDLPSWPPRSWVIGDTITWNEALKMAEEARGKKFEVTFDSLDDLKQSKITELPGNVPRYAVAPKPLLDGILSIWSIGFAQGWFDLLSKKGYDRTANEVVPEIDVLKFKDFLNRCWMRG